MVSVIVAAYNTEEYIVKCLDSLRNQVYRDFEVITVVDGATDNTMILCEKFSAEDERFITVYRENGGLAAARNTGLERARGDYIAFVDSDDYVSPMYLETLVKAVEKNECDISACGYILEDEAGNEEHRTEGKDRIMDAGEFLNNMLVPIDRSYGAFVWNKLYKSDIIKTKHIRFPDKKRYLFEDHYFNYEYMKHVKKGCYVSVWTYHYIKRRNTGIIRGITENSGVSDKWLRYADVFDLIINDSYEGFEIFRKQIKMMKVWHCATAVRVLGYYNMKTAPEYANMRRYIRKNMAAYLTAHYINLKKRTGMLLTYFAPKLAFKLWANRA